MYLLNEEIILDIIDLDDMGQGVAKINEFVFFVEGALPNEQVKAKITKVKKNIIFADTTEVLKKSDNRVSVCPYQKLCGGCALINLTYDKQAEYKQTKVKKIMNKFLKEDVLVKDIITNDNNYNYRNKVSFHCDKELGFYKNKTNKVIPIDECKLASNGINKLYKLFKDNVDYKNIVNLIIRYSDITLESMLIIEGEVNDSDIDKIKDSFTTIIINNDVYSGKGYIIDKLNDYSFIISPDSFFQVNTNQAVKLYDKALEYAHLTGNERVLDLYCGTGSIGIYVSSMAREVVGIEKNHSAIQDANRNASINNIKNISFIEGDTKYAVEKIDTNFDVIIVDPPRSGLFPNIIDFIEKVNPKYLVYVSCDPVTLARDLNLLKDSFNIDEITPVDMFSNTYHVENVCALSRKRK